MLSATELGLTIWLGVLLPAFVIGRSLTAFDSEMAIGWREHGTTLNRFRQSFKFAGEIALRLSGATCPIVCTSDANDCWLTHPLAVDIRRHCRCKLRKCC